MTAQNPCSAVSIIPDDQKDTSKSDLRPFDANYMVVQTRVRNKATGSILRVTDGSIIYFTSSDLCVPPNKGGWGNLLWLARLTPQQKLPYQKGRYQKRADYCAQTYHLSM